MGMAVAVTSAATTGQWPGPAAGQFALAGGQYYCPVAAESLVQAPGAAQTADQLVYAAPSAGPQHGSYQTVELSDGGHHLVAAGQSSEVRQLRFNLRVYEVLRASIPPPPLPGFNAWPAASIRLCVEFMVCCLSQFIEDTGKPSMSARQINSMAYLL